MTTNRLEPRGGNVQRTVMFHELSYYSRQPPDVEDPKRVEPVNTTFSGLTLLYQCNTSGVMLAAGERV